MTDQEFNLWLQDEHAIRIALVEVEVASGGSPLTRYLSTGVYHTGAKNMYRSSENLLSIWNKGSCSITEVASVGTTRAFNVSNTPNAGSYMSQAGLVFNASKTYVRSVIAKAVTGTGIIHFENYAAGAFGGGQCNLLTGVANGSARMVPLADGEYLCYCTTGVNTTGGSVLYIGNYGPTAVATTVRLRAPMLEEGDKPTIYAPTDPDHVGPIHTTYQNVVDGGIRYTENLSIGGTSGLSFGDFELINTDGALDSWLDDIWMNRKAQVFIGDPRWARAHFRMMFDGVVADIGSKNRTRLNLKLRDKLQRLNTPATENKLGGTTQNKDRVRPLLFGECHNIEPLLVDPALHEYQIHDGPIERIIEVRDNGLPVSYTATLSAGTFRLAASPVGTITVSAQGSASKNLLTYSEGAIATLTQKSNVTDAVTPIQGFSTSIQFGNSAVDKWAYHNFTPAVGTKYALQLVVQMDDNGVPSVGNSSANDFYMAGNNLYVPSTARHIGGNRYLVTGVLTTTTTNGNWGVAKLAGQSTRGFRVTAYQLEEGENHNKYVRTDSTAVGVLYSTVAQIVKVLATRYGKVSDRFTLSDLDQDALDAFDTANPQPVGVYLRDRTNILQVLQGLAASVGAQLSMTRLGKLRLLRLGFPGTGTAVPIVEDDMVIQTFQPSARTEVQAAIKLGYAKNWTVQPDLQSGLLAEHKVMFSQEWLTATKSDDIVAANYRLSEEPTQKDSYLLTLIDANAEAQRLLDIQKVPRMTYRFDARSSMLNLDLGQAVNLKYSRFGLSAGKAGVVVGLQPDWVKARTTVEVMI